MQEKSDIQQGWDFYSNIIGLDSGSQIGSSYVNRVDEEITKLTKNIISLKSNQTDPSLGGFIAEEWHSGTFNIKAAVEGSKHKAFTLKSNLDGSVDVGTNFGKEYSLKYMATAEDAVSAQGQYSHKTGTAKYYGQERLVATDQLDESLKIASRRVAKNSNSRPHVSESYNDTAQHLTDVISDGEGVESIRLTKEESLRMARRVKQDEFDLEEFGVNLDNVIETKHIFKNAIKSGATAAAVTVAMQITPEIVKVIDYLIKNGEIDLVEIKQIGTKAISASAEGFLRGSISCAVQIMCEKGLFGEALKSANPTIVGTLVAIVLETVKNSIMVASGRITPREMGMAFIDSAVISSSYIAGAKIGGFIGQTLGIEFPVVGYIIGSFVGCVFATVYNIGKNKLISFCSDTGFTCFGLVEQNYELPEEVLSQIGIKTIHVHKVEVKKVEVKKAEVKRNNIKRTELQTVDFILVRRGVIGVNKIGYVLQ